MLAEVFLREASLQMLVVAEKNMLELNARSRRVKSKPILNDETNCSGRHNARTKAIPEERPVRRGCWNWNARAKLTRMTPPNNGPSPNSRESKKPEVSCLLQYKNYNLETIYDLIPSSNNPMQPPGNIEPSSN